MSKKFTGLLAKPMQWNPKRKGLNSIEGLELLPEKLGLLFERYGLPDGRGENDYFPLVLAMARDFVPGFQVEGPKKRRPKERQIGQGAGKPPRRVPSLVYHSFLVADMMKVMNGPPPLSASSAASVLTKSSRFANRWDGANPDTLKKEFSNARKNEDLFEFLLHCMSDMYEEECYQNSDTE